MQAKTETRNGKLHGGTPLRLVRTEDAPRRIKAPARVQTEEPERPPRKKTAAPGSKLAYSVSEAAAALGVSEWYIRDEIGREQIAVSRARGRVIIPRWELIRYLKENMQGGPARTAEDEEDAAPQEADRPAKLAAQGRPAAAGHKRMI